MVNKAKSTARKAHEATEQKAGLYAKALDVHLEEQQKPSKERKDLWTVCTEVSNEHFAQTHCRIDLSSSTLDQLVKGSKLKSESNAEKSWITPEEAEIIIAFATEMAKQGFPLTHKQLTEHANLILKARLGGQIKVYLSRSLDAKHAQAVNSTVNTAWFDLLGPTGERVVQEVVGENHELTTVLCTICANGTSLPPLVIFKGKAFFVKWGMSNPLNCQIGRSETGWTNGEIGVYPFNPNAIKASLLKPSIESSHIGSGLPLAHSQMTTPLHVVLQLLKDVQSCQPSENSSLASSQYTSENPSVCTSERPSGYSSPTEFLGTQELQQLADESLKALKNSSAGFLFSNQPIASSSELPPLRLPPAPPANAFIQSLLKVMLETEREHDLQQAIQELQKWQAYQDGQIVGMQSSLLLQETYCKRLRGQLKAKEKKKDNSTRLLRDGMPVALSADEFYELAVARQRDQVAAEKGKELTRQIRALRAEELKAWKVDNELWKEENEKIKACYRIQVASWEEQKAKPKTDGVKFSEKSLFVDP
ncbi:hypothetical protein M0805_002075 [Coniferiporia weirii]|nr:hypothetical protein M0805_002075 [Coniferiporia weirii]